MVSCYGNKFIKSQARLTDDLRHVYSFFQLHLVFRYQPIIKSFSLIKTHPEAEFVSLNMKSGENKPRHLSITQPPTLINNSPLCSFTLQTDPLLFPLLDPPHPGALNCTAAGKQACPASNNAEPGMHGHI